MATATTPAANARKSFVIPKKSGGNFVYMTEGLHQAVVAEVKDLGIITGAYGAQHKFVFRFVNAEGEEASRFYTPSIGEKATLYKDFNSMVDMTGDEFDIYSLEGQQCQVLVTEGTKSDGTPNAKVEKVLKPVKGQNVVAPKNGAAPAAAKPAAKAAVKKTNAASKKAAQAAEDAAALEGTQITDDDIPF